jgi:hypothetical protein
MNTGMCTAQDVYNGETPYPSSCFCTARPVQAVVVLQLLVVQLLLWSYLGGSWLSFQL